MSAMAFRLESALRGRNDICLAWSSGGVGRH